MKYFITLIALLIIFLYGQLMDIELPPIFNILLVSGFFVISFLWEYSIIPKNFKSDFKIRSIKKSLGLYEFLFPLFWTVFLLYSNGKFTYMILIFWCIPFAELAIYFIYKIKKPHTIFINENVLILNNRWTQKRDLVELVEIQFDRFSKKLKLDFKSKSKVTINTNEYKTDDIQKFLEILIEKSDSKVLTPKNFY